ncbi:MAG: hypothetical protein ACXVBB_14080, partial [Isosphaeraceae bacterium]
AAWGYRCLNAIQERSLFSLPFFAANESFGSAETMRGVSHGQEQTEANTETRESGEARMP